MSSKKFQSLNLSDAFLFTCALEQKEICELVLQCILGEKIELDQIEPEHTIMYAKDVHSIRLDIYANSKAKITYNLEMQNEDTYNLPLRSRFYQSHLDMSSLSRGEDYRELKPCYVIFICDFDPFKRGLFRYTFESRCIEEDFPLEDRAKRIFLNTHGKTEPLLNGITQNNVPEELKNFLCYLIDSTTECAERLQDPLISELHERITEVKQNHSLEAKFMQINELTDRVRMTAIEEGAMLGREQGERLGREQGEKIGREQGEKIGREQGEKIGREQGVQDTLALIDAMIKDNRTDDIARLYSDQQFYTDMLNKYKI